MAFFNSAITVLQTLVVALGAGLGVWGAINLLECYGNVTNMGIEDIAETVNHAAEATEKTVSEAKQLLSAEERYADGLKRFL